MCQVYVSCAKFSLAKLYFIYAHALILTTFPLSVCPWHHVWVLDQCVSLRVTLWMARNDFIYTYHQKRALSIHHL